MFFTSQCVLLTTVPEELSDTLKVHWLVELAQVASHSVVAEGVQLALNPPAKVKGKKVKTVVMPALAPGHRRYLSARLDECAQVDHLRRRGF